MQATIAKCSFESNIADIGGAASCSSGTTFSVTESRFHGNKAGGAAISLLTDISAKLQASSLSSDGLGSGGAICCKDCSVLATNTTFYNNNAIGDGGGVNAWGDAHVSSRMHIHHSFH